MLMPLYQLMEGLNYINGNIMFQIFYIYQLAMIDKYAWQMLLYNCNELPNILYCKANILLIHANNIVNLQQQIT